MADILSGLEQRISSYKSKLTELQKKRDRVDEEIRSIKKYIEHAEILFSVEKDKAQPATQTSVPPGDADRAVSKEARDFLLSRSKYSTLSIPQAAFLLLKEAGKPMHAKEIYSRLTEGGVRIKGKTPLTSIAISLNRDKRFLRIAPNTFKLAEEE